MALVVYSDGSCEGGRGQGGYGWVVVQNGEVIMSGYGGLHNTTNNIAELTGALEGLGYLLEHQIHDKEGITLIADSLYVLNIANGTFTPKKNLEHTLLLRELATVMKIKTQWVRGHNGNEMNEICDQLAKMGRRKVTTKKKKRTK